MNASVGAESHEVELLARLAGILVSLLHLCVLHDRAVLAGAVDFHEVLIHDASGTDVEVSHLRVAHLSVGQAHVFAAGVELRVCRDSREIVKIRCRSVVDDVTLAVFADSPSVENHQ